MTPHPDTSALHTRLKRDGFAFVTADIMGGLLDADALTD